jgi:hypothetical protein
MYLAHQLVHTDEKPYGCNLCTKQFKRISDLNKHVKRVHNKQTREFTCLECNKAFFTKSDLIWHQIVHNNNGEGSVECYFCHQKSKKSSYLVDHMRIHTQEQPFICNEESIILRLIVVISTNTKFIFIVLCQHQNLIKWLVGFGLVIFVCIVVAALKTLPFICVFIPKKFRLSAVFARKNFTGNCLWIFTLLPIQMRNHSNALYAITNLKQIVTFRG